MRERLQPIGLRIALIKSDGHCLYRAVAQQLAVTGRQPHATEEDFRDVRQRAAHFLRSHADTYMPFIEADNPEEYNSYCDTVQNTAEWGGQVELQALSESLEVPIEVWKATEAPLSLGSEYPGTPLRVSFHEHYYALGAHYNSVISDNT